LYAPDSEFSLLESSKDQVLSKLDSLKNQRRFFMNQDIVKGQWKQIRGKAKEWWGKLTNDDLDLINGNRDQLIGKLQERYGYNKERAIKELNRRLEELDQTVVSKHVG
jgi:uncharacterized protein YjbJ (UPF0337 family)